MDAVQHLHLHLNSICDLSAVWDLRGAAMTVQGRAEFLIPGHCHEVGLADAEMQTGSRAGGNRA